MASTSAHTITRESPPTPTQIRGKRRKAKLTQREAADLVHASMRTWQDWENGKRRMSLLAWELFNLLVDYEPVRKARASWQRRRGR